MELLYMIFIVITIILNKKYYKFIILLAIMIYSFVIKSKNIPNIASFIFSWTKTRYKRNCLLYLVLYLLVYCIIIN